MDIFRYILYFRNSKVFWVYNYHHKMCVTVIFEGRNNQRQRSTHFQGRAVEVAPAASEPTLLSALYSLRSTLYTTLQCLQCPLGRGRLRALSNIFLFHYGNRVRTTAVLPAQLTRHEAIELNLNYKSISVIFKLVIGGRWDSYLHKSRANMKICQHNNFYGSPTIYITGRKICITNALIA